MKWKASCRKCGLPTRRFTVSPYEPSGDQPQAIQKLASGIEEGLRYQTLLGVTGSGKTFTMAKTIEAVQKPTLVMAPNKPLAAQLASELKEFFPDNAVVYFVSYYDYYQPEAYVPSSDTFIEKDASINEEVEKLRHAATSALLSRRDVIVVASVSCIYGIGSPMDYAGMAVFLDKQKEMDRDQVIHDLIDIQYDRNDYELKRGTFRVRGDNLDVFPPYADNPIRVEFWGDEIEEIAEIDNVTGEVLQSFEALPVWPASHYVTARPKMEHAIKTIQEELRERLQQFKDEGKLLEAQRLEMRVNYDLEMLETMGFCSGIENYSRHLDGREPGEPPYTLIDYFPKDFLCIIDESHVTVPQIRGMHEGDRSRKITLTEHGFRLPSCLDNRPLRFDEFEERIPQFVYVSATPGDYELKVSQQRVEQIIRPTGLLDPEIIVRGSASQIDDIVDEAKERADRSERVLITTLTKKMAEDLTDHLLDPRALYAAISARLNASTFCVICAWVNSMCWWASTCCVRAYDLPGGHAWPSQMPTKRASCATSAALSRRLAVQHVTRKARSSCMPIKQRIPWTWQSAKPGAAAASRWRTTKSMVSRRKR